MREPRPPTPRITLGEYLGYTCGLSTSTTLYDLGLTREHAHAVWYGQAYLTEDDIHLIHQVYRVPIDTLNIWAACPTDQEP